MATYGITAESINLEILASDTFAEFCKVPEKLNRLKNIEKELKIALAQVQTIVKSTEQHIKTEVKKYQNELDLVMVDRRLKDKEQKIIRRNCKMTTVAPGITLPIIKITSPRLVPNYPLYYDESTNKFCIRVLGKLISGNVGNIVHKNAVITKNQTWPTWKNSQWLHVTAPTTKHHKIKHMRTTGVNRNSLKNDILNINENEIKTRSDQLMHDFLIFLCISKIHPGIS